MGHPILQFGKTTRGCARFALGEIINSLREEIYYRLVFHFFLLVCFYFHAQRNFSLQKFSGSMERGGGGGGAARLPHLETRLIDSIFSNY